MVWSAAYVNAAVLQDTYSGGGIQRNSRLYFLQDANWNTTAVVGYNGTTGTWDVTQRYVYSPYGTITVLNADWSTPPAGTQPTVSNLYQGMTLDSVTGLYYARNRNYDPSLGRWINQDPAGYINGANTYQFVMGNPVNAVDPWGLHWWDSNWWWLVPPVKIGGMVADYFINGEKTRAAAKQLPRVKQDWMDRAVYGRVNQCPGTAEPAAELRAVSDAQKTAASGGVLPGTTPGGPLPVPGVSVEINVAKGLTIGINKGVGAVAGGGAPTTNK